MLVEATVGFTVGPSTTGRTPAETTSKAGNMAGGDFFLEGPHCHHHDYCNMLYCDAVDTETVYDAVLFFCKEIRRCTYCGPTSPAWPRLVRHWVEWAVGWCGTAVSAKLRQLGVPSNVIEVAELIEAHPVPAAGGTLC